MAIESLSAITLSVSDMARSARFYSSIGFELAYGGADAGFSTFRAGGSYLNLTSERADGGVRWWGRVIFYVDDVDATHARAIAAGYEPSTAPADARWGERYFHITDPDGHELSFARPLER